MCDFNYDQGDAAGDMRAARGERVCTFCGEDFPEEDLAVSKDKSDFMCLMCCYEHPSSGYCKRGTPDGCLCQDFHCPAETWEPKFLDEDLINETLKDMFERFIEREERGSKYEKGDFRLGEQEEKRT